jgi:ABC-type branched-subunit amino acid transport system substrate-binding protein
MEKVGDQLGLKLVGSSFLPLPTVPNFDPYAAKVAKSGADAVMVVTFPGQAIPMVNAVEDQGFHPDWIFNGDVPRPSDLKQLGKATERTYVAGDVPPLTAAGDHPQLQQYIDELDAYGQESGDEAADTSDVRGSTIRAWLAMQFINQVADQMKDGSAESLKAALDGAKDLQSDLIPPWNPSAKSCVPGYDRVSNPNLYFLKVQPSGDMELADEQTYDVSEYLC